MLYELWFTDDQGRARTLLGHKVITDHPGLDLWPDTTTLYTTILEGHVERRDRDSAHVVGPIQRGNATTAWSRSETPGCRDRLRDASVRILARSSRRTFTH